MRHEEIDESNTIYYVCGEICFETLVLFNIILLYNRLVKTLENINIIKVMFFFKVRMPYI